MEDLNVHQTVSIKLSKKDELNGILGQLCNKACHYLYCIHNFAVVL